MPGRNGLTWTLLLLCFVLASFASAQSITAPSLTECVATTITWSGTAPFHVWIVDSSAQNGTPLEDFGTMNATSMYWSVNIPAGESVMFAMQGADDGATVFSAAQTIAAGSCGDSSSTTQQISTTTAAAPAPAPSTSQQPAPAPASNSTTSSPLSPSTTEQSSSTAMSSVALSSSQTSTLATSVSPVVIPTNSSTASAQPSSAASTQSLSTASTASASRQSTPIVGVSPASLPSATSTSTASTSSGVAEPIGTPNTGNNNLPQDAQGGGSKSGGLSTGAKIGVAIGVILGLLAIALTGLLVFRTIRGRRDSEYGEDLPFRELDEFAPYPYNPFSTSKEKIGQRPQSEASLSEWLRGTQPRPPAPRPLSTSSSFESGSPGAISYHQPIRGYRPSSTFYESATEGSSRRETALPSSNLTRSESGSASEALPSSGLSRNGTLNTQSSVYVDVVKRNPLEPGFLQLPPTSYRPIKRSRENSHQSALSPIPSSAALPSSYQLYTAVERERASTPTRSSQVLPTADTGTFTLPFLDITHSPWLSDRGSPEDVVSNHGGFPFEDARVGSTVAEISRASRIRMSSAIGRRQTMMSEPEGFLGADSSPEKSGQSSGRDRKEWASGVPRSARTVATGRMD
ncbi:hypothetical protein BCR39DRAFT_586929 [Naematelia encephala]|uniref:Mid2 domain-containing protein n=1 Tax=Naematelia encephala TaxID=71784 RepID=A0A1Y2BDM8_9TREE|nr:hypothetical protein BCR39DRAFT_586929 [Naematelia encephala]